MHNETGGDLHCSKVKPAQYLVYHRKRMGFYLFYVFIVVEKMGVAFANKCTVLCIYNLHTNSYIALFSTYSEVLTKVLDGATEQLSRPID